MRFEEELISARQRADKLARRLENDRQRNVRASRVRGATTKPSGQATRSNRLFEEHDKLSRIRWAAVKKAKAARLRADRLEKAFERGPTQKRHKLAAAAIEQANALEAKAETAKQSLFLLRDRLKIPRFGTTHGASDLRYGGK